MPTEGLSMTGTDLLDVLALEDLDDVAARLEAERSRARDLPLGERQRREAELRILGAELRAQRANECRRRGGRA